MKFLLKIPLFFIGLTLVFVLVLLPGSVGSHPAGMDDYPIYLPLVAKQYPQQLAFIQTWPYHEIYLADTVGHELAQLTNTIGWEFNLTWSPDGTQLAFDSHDWFNGELKFTIYVMNADGTTLVQLTDPTWDSLEPSWSPAGDQIAFVSDRNNDGLNEIYTMNTDGTQLQPLVIPDLSVQALDWSPDNTQFVFSAYFNFEADIYSIGVDGTGLQQLTTSIEQAQDPTWSHDGTKIAFSQGDFGNLYVMNPDGSQVTLLTTGSEPAWSPDDKTLAYLIKWSGPDIWPIGNLWLVRLDGSDPLPVTDDLRSRFSPQWVPN